MDIREYKIKSKELSIDIGDWNFLCAFGTHINGGWIAIINWGLSAELSALGGNIPYNTNKIYKAFSRADVELNDDCKLKLANELSKIVSPLIEEMESKTFCALEI